MLLARAHRKTGAVPSELLVRREALEALLRRVAFGKADGLQIVSRPAGGRLLGLYEFTLSNGAVLWVKPGHQKATFSWGVRVRLVEKTGGHGPLCPSSESFWIAVFAFFVMHPARHCSPAADVNLGLTGPPAAPRCAVMERTSSMSTT